MESKNQQLQVTKSEKLRRVEGEPDAQKVVSPSGHSTLLAAKHKGTKWLKWNEPQGETEKIPGSQGGNKNNYIAPIITNLNL